MIEQQTSPQPQAVALPTIRRDDRRLRVLFADHEVADSHDVLVLREPGQPPVFYFPRADVAMMFLGETDRRTVSPTKGEARWFTIYRDQHIVENAIWSFEHPLPGFEAIAGRIAFLPKYFDLESEGHSPDEWDQQTGGPD